MKLHIELAGPWKRGCGVLHLVLVQCSIGQCVVCREVNVEPDGIDCNLILLSEGRTEGGREGGRERGKEEWKEGGRKGGREGGGREDSLAEKGNGRRDDMLLGSE